MNFKKSKEERFQKIIDSIEDQKYKEWAVRNKGTFICRPKTQKQAYIDAIEEMNANEKTVKMKPFFKGEIYFSDLTPDKSGKIRPVLIFQNDDLNRAVYLNLYHSVIIIPLTSRLLGGDYRVKIEKRDLMTKTSEIVCNAMGLVSADRILFKKGVVTVLTKEELKEVEEKVKKVLGV